MQYFIKFIKKILGIESPSEKYYYGFCKEIARKIEKGLK